VGSRNGRLNLGVRLHKRERHPSLEWGGLPADATIFQGRKKTFSAVLEIRGKEEGRLQRKTGTEFGGLQDKEVPR